MVQRIKLTAIGAVRRMPETEPEDYVLLAETFELNVQNVFKGERHDSMLLQNEVPSVIHLVHHIPSVNPE